MDREADYPQQLPDAGLSAQKQSLMRRAERHVLRRLASGFIVVVPLLISVLVLYFFVYQPVEGFFHPLLKDTTIYGRSLYFPGLGVVITLAILYVFGAFLTGRRFQAWQDAVVSRIPIFRTIYGVARQTTAGLTSSSGHHYSRVVFVEWPRPGVRAMGFVTGHFSDARTDGSPLVAVYIPTVPNPTSGMLAFFPEEDITDTNITVQEAMKTIFSGGIVLPEAPERRELQATPQFDEEFTP